MKHTLEKIDLTKVKSLYFYRGYETEEDDNYCTSLVLVGDFEDNFDIKLFISKKNLSISNWKELMRYAKGTGLNLSADVLKADFNRFYNNRAFRRVKM